MAVFGVPVKTQLGVDELRGRSRSLGQRHRTVLLLIDGRRSVGEVLSLAQQAGAQASHFEDLLRMGMAEMPVTASAVVAPAAQVRVREQALPQAQSAPPQGHADVEPRLPVAPPPDPAQTPVASAAEAKAAKGAEGSRIEPLFNDAAPTTVSPALALAPTEDPNSEIRFDPVPLEPPLHKPRPAKEIRPPVPAPVAAPEMAPEAPATQRASAPVAAKAAPAPTHSGHSATASRHMPPPRPTVKPATRQTPHEHVTPLSVRDEVPGLLGSAAAESAPHEGEADKFNRVRALLVETLRIDSPLFGVRMLVRLREAATTDDLFELVWAIERHLMGARHSRKEMVSLHRARELLGLGNTVVADD